ncbi:MAG TPA: winged helix-turn-helix domain-containing protein [Nitrososphaerales archaeon]|nr:winged helix-turn-helix domain-containing protein [Nitrososphaerales archaeon]
MSIFYESEQTKPPFLEKQRGERRSRREILCDILLAIDRGYKRNSAIIYAANVSWSSLVRYLKLLEKEGLVSENRKGVHTAYSLSEKGKQFVVEYLRLNSTIEPVIRQVFEEANLI